MNKKYHLIFHLITILFISACGMPAKILEETKPAPLIQSNLPPEQIITIGIVSDDPAKALFTFQPLVDYLAVTLKDENIMAGKVIVTGSIDDMVEKLKTGEVDIFFESPFGSYLAYKQAGATPLLRRWKGGIEQYYTVIIVSESSKISAIEDLRGKMIAFEDQGSTSGYMLPKSLLLEKGFTLTPKSDFTSAVDPGEIGYFFAGSNENAIALLLANKIEAMTIQYDDYQDLPSEQSTQIRIIAETQSVPRHMVMTSPTMSSSLNNAIKIALTNLENSNEGRLILEKTEETTRFDEFPLGPQQTMEFLSKLFNLDD